MRKILKKKSKPMNSEKKILINGDFLCRNLTGIERFATEVCIRLDKLIKPKEISLYVPADFPHIPDFMNIEVIISKHRCNFFPLWEHVFFAHFARKQKALPLDFSNITPLFYPGIVFIHDIYARLYPEDFKSVKDKLIKLYACSMYRHAAKKAKRILTVSEFSKGQIAEIYKIPVDRISVVNNGWDHFKSIKPDDTIFKSFPVLYKNSYFFSLGSLSLRKNLKWIADYAQKHQNDFFAVSGKAISGLVPPELKQLQKLKNVVMLGYVTDGQVKSLMNSCKAFIFPSYYEGFGIPPLEALSTGCPVIISNASCLPEIYGDCAHYINPYKTDVDLTAVLKETVSSPDKILEKYTYAHAAVKLQNILSNI